MAADGSPDQRAAVLVSGGAGGIGAAGCEAVAAMGLRPIVGYRGDSARAEAVASRTGGVTLRLDLASAESIQAALDTLEGVPALAAAVLAASPPPVLAPFARISESDLNEQWQVSVLGHHRLLAGLVRRCFRKHKKGTVVGVLTAALGDESPRAAAGLGAYVIAKHGMAGLLALAAAEFPWLRVRTIKPGYTETPMLSAFDARFLELERKKRTFSTPRDVARLIAQELVTP